MKRNVDFVAYTSFMMSSWTFHIVGKSRKLSDVSEEILDITKNIFDISSGFFIPTKIRYGLQVYSEDIPANEYFKHDIKQVYGTHKEIISDKGISYQEFSSNVRSVETSRDQVKYIGLVDFLDGKTRLVFKGNDMYLDKHSKGLYASWSDEDDEIVVLEEIPLFDPLTFSIIHSDLKNENQRVEVTDSTYYEIRFRTYSDIWFEDMEYGRENRKRLRHIFNKLYEKFSVAYVSVNSEWFSDEELKNVAFGKN